MNWISGNERIGTLGDWDRLVPFLDGPAFGPMAA